RAGGAEVGAGRKAQLFPGAADIPPVVIPRGEAGRRRLKLITQGRGPEPGKPLRVGTVDHQLEADSHRSHLAAVGHLLTACTHPRTPALAQRADLLPGSAITRGPRRGRTDTRLNAGSRGRRPVG